MPSPIRPLLAILVLGAFAQVAQAVLIREALVVFYGNEVSLGAFYGSWLLWLAVGSAAALAWAGPAGAGGGCAAAVAGLRLILCALPLVLASQVLVLRSVRRLMDVTVGAFVPLGDLFLTLTLVNLPGGVLLGLAFALTCRALDTGGAAVGPVARTYAADALGALLGGVLFTFVLIRWLRPVATLGLMTSLMALTAASLGRPGTPGAPSTRSARRVGAWLPWPLALAGLLLTLPPIARPLERALEEWRFASLQPGMELLDALDTPYGHVAVARLGQQTSVVADGQVQQSFPLPLEVELRPFLDAAGRAALADPRLNLHFADARRFLRRLAPGATYDLILSLDATPASAAGNRLFTREAFDLVRTRLAPGGVFCTSASGSAAPLRTVPRHCARGHSHWRRTAWAGPSAV